MQFNGNRIHGNQSIRPSYNKVQKNVNSIGSNIGITRTEIISNEQVPKNTKNTQNTQNIKNIQNIQKIQKIQQQVKDDELELPSMLLSLNTLGLNKINFLGMTSQQVINYYDNFTRKRQETNSHKLAYDILLKIKKKQEINKEMQNIIKQNNVEQNNIKQNNIKQNNVKQNNIIGDNTTNKVADDKHKKNISNQIMTIERIETDKNIIIKNGNIIMPDNDDNLTITNKNKSRKSSIVKQKNVPQINTSGLNADDKLSVVNGVSYVMPSEFVLDKM
jgi:hypothetical protein